MPTSIPASASARTASEAARWRRRARLGRPPHPLVERREGDVHADPHLRGRGAEHVDVANDERAAGDDREGRSRRGELDDARAREPEASFRGLVGIRGGPERDLLVLPRATGQLSPQYLGDVRLDADRSSVAIVGRAVGALLEVPDVTESDLCTQPMYGFSDHLNGIPRTCVSADLHGSIRYSTAAPASRAETQLYTAGRRRTPVTLSSESATRRLIEPTEAAKL